MDSQPTISPEKDDKKPDKWEIENAADTLMKAEQIKTDKRLMPHVHKHLHEKKKQVIRSIEELKQKSHDRRMELAQEEIDGPGEEKEKLTMADPSPAESVKDTKVPGHK